MNVGRRVMALFAGASVLALVLAPALSGCGGGTGAEGAPGVVSSDKPRDAATAVSDADLHRLVAGNNASAIDLFRQVRGGTAGNLILSPYSISCVMAMAAAGAQGKTGEEIAAALHFSLQAGALHPAFNRLQLDLAQRPAQAKPARGPDAGKEVLSLQSVQGLFGSPKIPWKRDFLDLLAAAEAAGDADGGPQQDRGVPRIDQPLGGRADGSED